MENLVLNGKFNDFVKKNMKDKYLRETSKYLKCNEHVKRTQRLCKEDSRRKSTIPLSSKCYCLDKEDENTKKYDVKPVKKKR